MSVFHNLQIAPKSNTSVKLGDIKDFISNLAQNGHIEKEFTILTGDEEKIKQISFWDFNNNSLSSELTNNKLEIIRDQDFQNLSDTNNYAFKIHLSKTSNVFKNLEIFKATELKHYPIFIAYFGKPIDFTITKEDEETEEFEEFVISSINCILKSSGRNSESLWGLIENRDEFEVFFNEVEHFLGEFETGTYFD